MYVLLASVSGLMLLWWYWRPHKSPPGPRGIPFVGIVPLIGGKLAMFLHKCSLKYGKVMYARIGRKDWLILSDIGPITEAFVKQGKIFSGRPQDFSVMQRFEKNNYGVAFLEGDFWKSQRKFGMTFLRGIGVGKSNFEELIRTEVKCFLKVIENVKIKPYNPKGDVMKAIANMVYVLILGRRFDYQDKTLEMILKPFSDYKVTKRLRVMSAVPILFYHGPFKKTLKQFMKEFEDSRGAVLKIIEEHKKTLVSESPRNFIDAFLLQMNRENSPYFTEDQLVMYISDLLRGGTDTTTAALRWCLLALAHYPSSQERIQDEIDKVIGKNSVPTMKKREEMPYTLAFIQEVLRYCTVALLTLPHRTTEDVNISGYHIPKGTNVLANIWSVHQNSNLFENPREFNPERFLDDEGRFVKSKNVITFSVGPRVCLGKQISEIEMFLFLTMLLQKYKIEEDPNEILPPLDEGILEFVHSPQEYHVVFRPR